MINLTNMQDDVTRVLKIVPALQVSDDVVTSTVKARQACTLLSKSISNEEVTKVAVEICKAYHLNGETLVNKGTQLLKTAKGVKPNVEILRQAENYAQLTSVYYSKHRKQHVYIFSIKGEILEAKTRYVNGAPVPVGKPKTTYRHLLSGVIKPKSVLDAMGTGVLGDGLSTPTTEDMVEMTRHMASTGMKFTSSLVSYLSMMNNNKISTLLRGDMDGTYEYWKASHSPQYKMLLKHTQKDANGLSIMNEKMVVDLFKKDQLSTIVGLSLAHKVLETTTRSLPYTTVAEETIKVDSTPLLYNGALSQIKPANIFKEEIVDTPVYNVQGVNNKY